MNKMIITALFIILATSGFKCSKDDPISSHITIDPSMLVRCPALQKIDLETMTMGDLLADDLSLRQQYTECAIRLDCLIETVDNKATIICPTADKKSVPELSK